MDFYIRVLFGFKIVRAISWFASFLLFFDRRRTSIAMTATIAIRIKAPPAIPPPINPLSGEWPGIICVILTVACNVSDINFNGVLFSGAVLKETKVRERLLSILAACLATRSIITEVTMVTMAPTMLSRWRLLPAMEPLCWEEPWCVSRGGAG